jgi:hypothetical protein
MTLGELKTHIESFPVGSHFNYSLIGPFSWRGSYDEVAFGIVDTPSFREEILLRIEEALTEKFYGYKGGEYKCQDWTEVHFEEDTRSYTDGRYTSQWIAELEKGIPYQTQEHRLINLLFPNK